MPIDRYRSIEDVEPFAAAVPDPDNLRRALLWSAFCRRLHPWTAAPGVHRYRSIEEAGAARTGWERAARTPAAERTDPAGGYARIPQHTADEWGDVSDWNAGTTAASMRRLEAEERRAGQEPW